MKNYEDFEIYQLAKTLAVEIHKITLGELPKFEMYEQGSQIRRSSKSIGANIVEGFGRKKYKKENIQFLTYALASCFEYFMEKYEELGSKIYNFREAVMRG